MKLASIIHLRNGREVETMAEAVELLSRLPESRQERPVWVKTMEMLLLASKTRKAIDIRHATAQLVRALQAEGWMI